MYSASLVHILTLIGDKKYGNEELYVAFSELFDSLPLAAVIRGCASGTFFAVHGGISPTLQLATDINRLNRFREPPGDGLMCDLLWSDPMTPPANPSPVEMAVSSFFLPP